MQRDQCSVINAAGFGEVRGVEFSSGAHRELPVEVVDCEALLERAGSPLFDAAQRPSFGVLFVVRGGAGVHTVDFDDVQMVAGRLIFVFPGQIQRWHRGEALDASVVFARGGLPPMRGWFPSGRSYCDLGAESMTTALDLVAALGREQNRFEPDDVSVALMTSMFDVLVGLYRRATVDRSVDLTRCLPSNSGCGCINLRHIAVYETLRLFRRSKPT